VTILDAATGMEIDLGDGSDTLVLGNYTNTVSVYSVESIVGGSNADTVFVKEAVTGGQFNLGTGVDSITFAEGATATLTSVETINGSSYADNITISGAFTGAPIDLGGGEDYLTLGSASTLTASNTENITGSSGADVIVLTGSTNTIVDLGAGSDTIVFGAGIDTVTGGAGSDLFTFTSTSQSSGATADKITDFVAGTDKLVFSGLQSGTFNWLGSNATFSGNGNSEAYFVNSTDTLYVDVNGDGAVDMQITLSGTSASDLASTDFKWS
jgi:Ca2+-binding RTX toxin-like protein